MVGRIHNSPKLSELLPMSLLDLFRREGETYSYATRKTVNLLVTLLRERITALQQSQANLGLCDLRQLLSLTRQEISVSTGLKVSQIQQLEENKISIEFANKISHLLVSFMQEKITTIISQTLKNIQAIQALLDLQVIWERVTKIEEKDNPYPYLVDIEVDNHNFIAGNIIVHNSGLIPYLYKMGYKGPVYLTAPTRDISALLQLDLIGVAYKKAEFPLYKAEDIKEFVRHSICLDYGEVTDITPDIRITFYNAGHVLGSAQVHINIGNGLHNLVYSADTKYNKTRLLDAAINKYPRVETLTLESTYGAKEPII